MNNIESLFRFSGDDFEVWKSHEYGITYYNLSIEGYIGFEKLESFVDLYEGFLKQFKNYLIEFYEDEKKNVCYRNPIYRTRAIEIRRDSIYYFIFLDAYKSSSIWDLHDYMLDVIQQLKDFIKIHNQGHKNLRFN